MKSLFYSAVINSVVKTVGYVAVIVSMFLGVVIMSGGCAANNALMPDDDIYSTIAYYRPDEAGNCRFLTDDSLSLFADPAWEGDAQLNGTSRYLLYFHIMDNAGDTLTVDLMDVQEVYVSDILMGQVAKDILSDCDEATADAFWCSGKYLNMMYFSEVCGSGQCGFEAICPDTTMADAGAEVLDMYITYRSAGRGGSCTGACSFDMDSVLEAYPHVRTFRVMMKDMDVQYVDIVRPEENGAARDIMPVRM